MGVCGKSNDDVKHEGAGGLQSQIRHREEYSMYGELLLRDVQVQSTIAPFWSAVRYMDEIQYVLDVVGCSCM